MKKKNQVSPHLLIIAALFVGVTILFTACSNSPKGKSDHKEATTNRNKKSLLGAGSTFVYPLFSKLFHVYHKETGIQINYQSIGSGGGILQLKNKTVDFGDSDAPLSRDQVRDMEAEVLHVPICSGAIVISYHIPGVTKALKLTPEIISKIYLGKITKWNDPEIAQVNPKAELPELSIAVAHRADGSGTTNIFTDYLSKVSRRWKTKVGKGTAVNWPTGLGAKGNEGVAGFIKQTPGGIGYIELAYAMQNKMAYAKIQNKSGNYILPTIASTRAAGDVEIPEDGVVSLTNTAATDGYPISGFTWGLIYKEQHYNKRSQTHAEQLLKLMWWVTHKGQKYCADLHYAPLSDETKEITEEILNSAVFKGIPILKKLGESTQK